MHTRGTPILILASIGYIIVLGGATYEHLSVVPRWSAAPPLSLTMYQGEYSLNSAYFWPPMHLLALASMTAALVLHWPTSARRYVGAALAGYLLVIAITAVYFLPELSAITRTPYQPVVDPVLVERANIWEALSLVRLMAMVVIAVVLLQGLAKAGGDERNRRSVASRQWRAAPAASSRDRRSEQPSHDCRRQHRQHSPDGDPRRADQHGCSPDSCGDGAECDQAEQRHRRDGQHERGYRRDEDRQNGHSRTDSKRRRRGERGLQGARRELFGQAQLVARVRGQCALHRQLTRHGSRQVRFQPAPDVDPGELVLLGVWFGRQLVPLPREIRPLGVRLRTHRHVLAGGHRQRARDEPCDTGDQDVFARGLRGRHADDQTRG